MVDGEIFGSRPLQEPGPSSPPGKTFVRGGTVVNRMEFDKGGVGAADLRHLWALATEPRAWLGHPTRLLLFDSQLRAQQAGYDGCQLIAAGETGRELWLQLPEPDQYQRMTPGWQRVTYEGAFTEYEAARRWIFDTVGKELDAAGRPWWHKLTGTHRPDPELIRWVRPNA